MGYVIDTEYVEEKLDAYQVAIDALRNHESDADTAGSRDMRRKLADKLDRECQRWYNKQKPSKEAQDASK